jgi:hypothetical protein
MPNWRGAEKRPSDKYIVAWEIYSDPQNSLSERETIEALQSLRKKGLVNLELHGSTIWWALPQTPNTQPPTTKEVNQNDGNLPEKK